MGSAKEIATVPSVAHLGGVGVVNLAHRIHRSHVSRSDGTGKQSDPVTLRTSGRISDAQWDLMPHNISLNLFHLNISQPFAAGMPLVYGDLTRAPTGTLDHDPAINCDRLGTCVLKRMVHWMAQEVNASSPGSQPCQEWLEPQRGRFWRYKHKQTTLSLCGVLHEEIN